MVAGFVLGNTPWIAAHFINKLFISDGVAFNVNHIIGSRPLTAMIVIWYFSTSSSVKPADESVTILTVAMIDYNPRFLPIVGVFMLQLILVHEKTIR